MNTLQRLTPLATTAMLAVLVGCTSAQVTSQYEGSALPKPDRVLVYNFATSPDEIQAAKSGSVSDQQRAVGQKVANSLATELVKKLIDVGLSAERASGSPPASGNNLLIEGQIVSIDQGNRTERIVIGLGAGRTDVETHVQLLMDRDGGSENLEQLDVSAKGSRKPGAAETLGVGAVAGNLVIAGAVTAGTTAVTETVGGTVEADAGRTAKKIVAELKPFFERQGWL
jgi:hypothetical protein